MPQMLSGVDTSVPSNASAKQGKATLVGKIPVTKYLCEMTKPIVERHFGFISGETKGQQRELPSNTRA